MGLDLRARLMDALLLIASMNRDKLDPSTAVNLEFCAISAAKFKQDLLSKWFGFTWGRSILLVKNDRSERIHQVKILANNPATVHFKPGGAREHCVLRAPAQ